MFSFIAIHQNLLEGIFVFNGCFKREVISAGKASACPSSFVKEKKINSATEEKIGGFG